MNSLKPWVAAFVVSVIVMLIAWFGTFTINRRDQTSEMLKKSSDPRKMVTIRVSIPADAVGPRQQNVPPGRMRTFGKIENTCADPRVPVCVTDRSSQVVGGMLQVTYILPEGKETTIGYELNGHLRVDGIQVEGTSLTSFKVEGTPPEIWAVACFIPWKDDAGVVHALPSPNCTAQSTWHESSQAREDNISINSINGVSLASFNQLDQMGQNQYGIVCLGVTKKRYPILPPLEWFLSADFNPFALAFYGLGEEEVHIEVVDYANCPEPQGPDY